MAVTFKCPQCVAASLISKVGLFYPATLPGTNTIIYFDTSGNMQTTSGQIFYCCTNNHIGNVAIPTGF